MYFNTKAYTSTTLNFEISIHDILSLTNLCARNVKILLPAGTGCFLRQIPVAGQGWNTTGDEMEIDNGGGEGVLEINIEGFDTGEEPVYDAKIYANGFKSLYIRTRIGQTIYLQGFF